MALSVVIVFTVLDGRQTYLQPQLSGRILYQEKVVEHGLDLYTIVPLKKVTILSPKQFLPKPNHPYPSQKSNGRLLTDKQKRKGTSGILTWGKCRASLPITFFTSLQRPPLLINRPNYYLSTQNRINQAIVNYISNLFAVFNYSVLNKTDINNKVQKKGRTWSQAKFGAYKRAHPVFLVKHPIL